MNQEHFNYYKFSHFSLYPGDRLLLKNGIRMNLSGKDFDVLVYLVKKSKRLITHQELLNEIWKDVFVEEGNIATSISKIRKVLGDNSRKPLFIESIKGYGYRFMIDTEVIQDIELDGVVISL